MKDLEKEKQREHDDKAGIELVLEYCHCQTRLCDRIPCSLVEMLCLIKDKAHTHITYAGWGG